MWKIALQMRLMMTFNLNLIKIKHCRLMIRMLYIFALNAYLMIEDQVENSESEEKLMK